MTDQRKGGISWTHETWNPIRGCTRVNTDCIHCYAERVAATRLSGPGQPYHGLAEMKHGEPRWTGKVAFVDEKLLDPLRWKRPRLIFVNSMSDLFHEGLTDDQIDSIIAVMALAWWHTFQVLTKRPQRMKEHFQAPEFIDSLHGWIQMTMDAMEKARMPSPLKSPNAAPYKWPLPNVWLGTSFGHQKAADAFLPELLACRPHAHVLWVSAEPLIDRVTLHPPADKTYQLLSRWYTDKAFDPTGSQPVITRRTDLFPKIDWVVTGGESGGHARPMDPSWARELRDECQLAGVAFHHKQNGEYIQMGEQIDSVVTTPELMEGRSIGQPSRWLMPSGAVLLRVGRKAAGRQLDGREWNQYPDVKAARRRDGRVGKGD